MFDRFEQLDGEFNHITQEFEQSSYKIFAELAEEIKRFDEFIFYHSPDSLDPKEIVKAFRKFLKAYKVKGQVIPEFVPGSIEKGKVYFTLDNFAMWEILKECKAKKLKVEAKMLVSCRTTMSRRRNLWELPPILPTLD